MTSSIFEIAAPDGGLTGLAGDYSAQRIALDEETQQFARWQAEWNRRHVAIDRALEQLQQQLLSGNANDAPTLCVVDPVRS